MVFEFLRRTNFVLLAFGLCLKSTYGQYDQNPHIIVFMADDLGWNDVGFHGSADIPTPNIDALAYNGIILNKHYVQQSCTPTRAAFFSGRYPIRMGMQGEGIMGGEIRGLPLNVTILPKYLRDIGYTTALIGKWHLGFVTTAHTPTYRGFDSFLGYYNSHISYYDYQYAQGHNMSGFDMHRGLRPAHELHNIYATDLFTDEAVNIILKHEGSPRGPLYLQISHLGVHAPLEVPKGSDNDPKYRHIKDPNRRKYAKMVGSLDNSLGRVVNALSAAKMLNNSIILFLTDNGAPTIGRYPNAGSNFPFRGQKYTLYEGGVRGVAAIWSLRLQHSAFVSNDLIHVTDWLPTLYAAAGGNVSHLGDIDGVNQWPYLSRKAPHPRDEILLNIDEITGTAAAIYKQYKLIRGHYKNAHYDNYTGNRYDGRGTAAPFYNEGDVFDSLVSSAIHAIGDHRTQQSTMAGLRDRASVNCQRDTDRHSLCNVSECLFNLDLDPCETTNIADNNWLIVNKINKFLGEQYTRLVKRSRPHINWMADPQRRNNTWGPWLSEYDYGIISGAAPIGSLALCVHIGTALVIVMLQAFI